MGKEFVSEKEKKNKKRGILFAFFFHVALVIFGLLPFLTKEIKEPEYEKVIEIQFAQFDASSTKAQVKAGAEKKKAAKKTTKKKVEEKKPKPKPEPKPTPKKPKPVLTQKDTKTPPIKTSPDPKPTKTETPEPEPVEETTETTSEASETTTDADSNSDGDASSTGKGKGKGESGKDEGKGKQGTGKDGEDFTGTAIFSRKVIYRPDIKKIVKKKGRIAINLCINNDGRVVYVKYDKASSTIRDTDNIRKTLEATKQYKFERDYSVPKKQCGKLTFIIENN